MPDSLHLKDFMCVCSDKERAKAEACYERVVREVANGKAERLLGGVVMALHHDMPEGYYGSIEGIHCDQWFGVAGEVRHYEDGESKAHASIFVQCDLPEHGIARLYELARESVSREGVEPPSPD